MKLSKATDYAIVLLHYVDSQEPKEWIPVSLVSKKFGIPSSFLGNIVHRLVQIGILESQRGPKGGIRLAKGTEQITIGQVLSALDEGTGLVECMERPGECPIESQCDIRRFWSITNELVLAALKHISLKDIAAYLKPKTKIENILKDNKGEEGNEPITT